MNQLSSWQQSATLKVWEFLWHGEEVRKNNFGIWVSPPRKGQAGGAQPEASVSKTGDRAYPHVGKSLLEKVH